MNPQNSPREELELRITMLLLGELPADEAAVLRQQIAQDVSLKKLHDELQSTIGLVREVEKNPAASEEAALKLSGDRREKLLAHFKTPRPQESFWIRPMKLPAFVPMLVAVAIVALLVAMLLPALSGAKSRAMRANFAAKTMSLEPSSEGEPSAATPAPAAPTAVTKSPEPVLAPPPAPIVLPAVEPTVAVGGVSGSGGEPIVAMGKPSGSTQTFYRNVNGLRADSTPATVTEALPAGKPVDSLVQDGKFLYEMGKLDESKDKLNKALAKNPNDTAAAHYLALDDQAASTRDQNSHQADALLSLKQVEKQQEPSVSPGSISGIASASGGVGGLRNQGGGGGGGSSQNLNGFASADFDAQKVQKAALPESIPLGQFPGASTADRPGQFALDKKHDDGEITKGASQLHGTEPASRARRGFSKVTPLPGLRAPAAATHDAPATLAMPDVPANQVLTSGLQQAQQSSTPVAGDIAGNERSDLGMPASSFDQSKSKNIGNEMKLGSAHSLTDGATVDTFKTELAQDDANGVYYFIETNSVNAQKPQTQSATLAVNEAVLRQSPQVTANEKAYEIEKRKLADLEETHKMLNLKIMANSIDSKIPTTSIVQITDPAERSTKQTFWQSLRGEYASTAKVKVENEGGIINGFATTAATAMPYDPYFIQTTFEIMQSELVLGKVVDALHLQTAWADKNGGQKLTKAEAIGRLKSEMSLQPVKNTKLIAISMTSDKPEEAAKLANAVAQAYLEYRVENNQTTARTGLEVLQKQYLAESNVIIQLQSNVDKLAPKTVEPAKLVQPAAESDVPVRHPPVDAPVPQPEILTTDNAFSTFSLNVSDVSFKLAAASLEKGQMPEAATIRSEEFINAFNYRDPEATAGQPMAFASERARYPFALNRELLRFSIKTAAAGRPAGRALNLVLLLDNSGSMERADRVAIIREALRVLAGQLQPQDTVSVVTFARTARLWADGIAGDKAGETLDKVGDITPEGGTNLEEAMRLAYETAHRHYLANGMNRVVLLTDGAANLGNVDPAVLKQNVEAQRKQGIALDCFGIGFEGYDDDLLEQLSRNGDGRYAFINSPEEAGAEFAAKLAGALQIAAADVKMQVEFNPERVIAYRQIGYAKHQLTKEQFRDNTVDAAEIAAQEAGNALYTVQTKPDGTGPVATVHVRYKIPGTTDYHEHSWDVAYEPNVPALEQASPAMRLAGTASAFSEWLAVSPFAQEVTPDSLLKLMSGVPEVYGADERPKKLVEMIREAKSLSGK